MRLNDSMAHDRPTAVVVSDGFRKYITRKTHKCSTTCFYLYMDYAQQEIRTTASTCGCIQTPSPLPSHALLIVRNETTAKTYAREDITSSDMRVETW